MLRGYAGGRLCPSCLLREGLTPEIRGDETDTQTAGSDRGGKVSFADYELLEEVARGGMGVVYKARQRSLNRVVALKMILAGQLATRTQIERFRAEAESAANLQHPGIVAIHDIGQADGQHYFSMDYVEGRSLADLVRDRPLPARKAADYLKGIAEAVHYAHQQGVIHRDLKPSNILIDASERPRITDFGLAKRLTDDANLTLTGQMVGSPNYLPPEQAAGQQASERSDIYSLGAILYHLLVGLPPFQAESLTTLLKRVAEAEPVSPRLLDPSLPRDLETICLKCLEKEQSRRYQTAQELADELGRFLADEPIQARRVGSFGKTWKWCRRQPVRAALSAALILAVASGLTGVTWEWRRADRERATAQANELRALRHAYAGDMNKAQQSLEEGDLGRARQILDKYRPGQAGNPQRPASEAGHDLRGWEWRYLWGLCRSDEQFKLTTQSQSFVNLALSPDGALLALRQEDGNIDLWDWGTRQKTGTLTNRSWPLAMAFVPKGKLLAAADGGTNDPTVNFWDVTTRQIVRTIGQSSAVTSLAFSPNGEWLATFHMEPRLRLWSVESGKMVKDIPAWEAVNTESRIPVFSPDGATLAIGEMNGRIRLLALPGGLTNLTSDPSPGNAVMALAFSPDGSILASGQGYSDGTVRLWDACTGASKGSLEGHRGWVSRLVFTPDGQTLYSASADQTIRAWNVTQKKEIDLLRGHEGRLTGLALFPEGRTLVSCAEDGSVRVWAVKSKPRLPAHAVLPLLGAPYGAPFTADSRRLITASLNDPVIVWDVATASELERIPDLGTNNLSVALAPDDRLLAVGGLDGTIKIWDVAGRRRVKEFRPQRIPVFALRFWDGGRTLLTYATVPHQQIKAQRWDVESWVEIDFGQMDVSESLAMAQSPDQRFLAVPSRTGVRLWDYATGELKAAFLSDKGAFMTAFSPDSRLLAAAVSGGARVWTINPWRGVAAVSTHANPIISVAFSPDGQRLVTGGQVGMGLQPALRVWDYSIERDLISLKSVGEFTGWTGFSPDGNTLLGLSWTGVVDLYRAPSWDEIAAEERTEKRP